MATSKWKTRARVAAGLVIAAVGLVPVGHYVLDTAPGSAGRAVSMAQATVTSRSSQPSGWLYPDNYFPISSLVYREAFEFNDAGGTHRSGTDEVSAIFFGSHPEGSRITVYYRPDAPDAAVIALPERLVPNSDWRLAALGLCCVFGGAVLAANKFV